MFRAMSSRPIILHKTAASILDKTAAPESLQDLRDALAILRTWAYPDVTLRADNATSLLFASHVAMLAVDIRVVGQHCDLIVTLRTNSKTAMCAVEVKNIALRFAQVEQLVQALTSDESEIYDAFLKEYVHERRFVYSDIGMRDVGIEPPAAPISLHALRQALDTLPYAAHTKFMFNYKPAKLAVEIRAPNDLIVTLRTNSKTAMCAVDIQECFAQVERLVHVMDDQCDATTATAIYKAFWREYEFERPFVYSDIGMRDVRLW